MANGGGTDTWGARFLDYLGLGLILTATDILVREAALSLAVLLYVVGAAILALGLGWHRVKPRLSSQLVGSVATVGNDFRYWLAVLGVLVLAARIVPILHQMNPTQLVVAPPPTPPRLPEPQKPVTQLSVNVAPQAPTPLLGLTDATRWRFVTSFWDAVSANGVRPHCSATVSVKTVQPDVTSIGRPERLWDELQPLLSYSNWQISGGGLGSTSYRGGITILVGAGGGDPLICGSQLAEELQSRTPIQVSIRKNQVTPKLEECKYECVEIQVGDAVTRR